MAGVVVKSLDSELFISGKDFDKKAYIAVIITNF